MLVARKSPSLCSFCACARAHTASACSRKQWPSSSSSTCSLSRSLSFTFFFAASAWFAGTSHRKGSSKSGSLTRPAGTGSASSPQSSWCCSSSPRMSLVFSSRKTSFNSGKLFESGRASQGSR